MARGVWGVSLHITSSRHTPGMKPLELGFHRSYLHKSYTISSNRLVFGLQAMLLV